MFNRHLIIVQNQIVPHTKIFKTAIDEKKKDVFFIGLICFLSQKHINFKLIIYTAWKVNLETVITLKYVNVYNRKIWSTYKIGSSITWYIITETTGLEVINNSVNV